jgi:hypothetical protein
MKTYTIQRIPLGNFVRGLMAMLVIPLMIVLVFFVLYAFLIATTGLPLGEYSLAFMFIGAILYILAIILAYILPIISYNAFSPRLGHFTLTLSTSGTNELEGRPAESLPSSN